MTLKSGALAAESPGAPPASSDAHILTGSVDTPDICQSAVMRPVDFYYNSTPTLVAKIPDNEADAS
ncbi:hypothetical protein [Williamsia sp.]|uniref:hypothetical protein n=1 Tax=Williamsia sp. TaxID=1872085 RepID=UPI002F932A6F